MQILKKYANSFSIEFGFWVKNLGASCSNDHISRSVIENRKGITLWSLETYSKIIIKLKTIKYKIDIAYYLAFLLISLAIKASH